MFVNKVMKWVFYFNNNNNNNTLFYKFITDISAMHNEQENFLKRWIRIVIIRGSLEKVRKKIEFTKYLKTIRITVIIFFIPVSRLQCCQKLSQML